MGFTEARTTKFDYKAEDFVDTFKAAKPEALLGRNLRMEGENDLYVMEIHLHSPDYVEVMLSGRAKVTTLHPSEFDQHLPTDAEIHHGRLLACDDSGGVIEFMGATKTFSLHGGRGPDGQPVISDEQIALLRRYALGVPLDQARRDELQYPEECMPAQWLISNATEHGLEITVGLSDKRGDTFDLSATWGVVIDDRTEPPPGPSRPNVIPFKKRSAKPQGPTTEA